LIDLSGLFFTYEKRKKETVKTDTRTRRT